MDVPLCHSNRGVSEDLLNRSDVHTLLNQQCSGRVPAVMQAGFADVSDFQESLPLTPIVRAVDRSSVELTEHEIVIFPVLTCDKSLLCLRGTMGIQHWHEFRWNRYRPSTLPLGCRKRQSPSTLRTPSSTSHAVRCARSRTPVPSIPTIGRASIRMTMPFAILRTLLGMSLCSTYLGVVTTMPPVGSLKLPPNSHYATVKIDILPSKTKCALPARRCLRPPCVAGRDSSRPPRHRRAGAARKVAGDVGESRVDRAGHIPSHPAVRATAVARSVLPRPHTEDIPSTGERLKRSKIGSEEGMTRSDGLASTHVSRGSRLTPRAGPSACCHRWALV